MKPGLAVLPLEVWADIFLSPWFTREELAEFYNNIKDRAFANKLEKLLHGCGQQTLRFLKINFKPSLEPKKCKYELRKRKIPRFRTTLAVASRGHQFDGFEPTYKDCEFPDVEIPENVKNFKELYIGHLDDDVLDFLVKLKPLFTNVVLSIGSMQSAGNVRILFTHLLPMLDSIYAICGGSDWIEFLEQHFPETLAQTKELDLNLIATKAASIPSFLKWLTAPQNYWKNEPRFLNILIGRSAITFAIVDAVRQHFLSATTASTFVIFLQFFYDGPHNHADEIKLVNATTNELLIVRNACFKRPMYGDIHYAEVLRHPVGADARMREWVEKRAYFEKEYTDDYEEKQVISTAWPTLTIGHISKKKKARAKDQSEEQPAGEEDDESGPSTSANEMKK